MKIKIYGNNKETDELFNKVKICIDELGLSEFIELEKTFIDSLKDDLGIKKIPALIIEEESIDFKDIIFEGIVPDEEEIKGMLTSIIGGGEGGGCSTGGCGSGCSC